MTASTVAGDYRALLRDGYVRRDLKHTTHEQWRQAMRRRATHDRLRIRTGAQLSPPHVWATLLDWSPTEPDGSRGLQRLAAVTNPTPKTELPKKTS